MLLPCLVSFELLSLLFSQNLSREFQSPLNEALFVRVLGSRCRLEQILSPEI